MHRRRPGPMGTRSGRKRDHAERNELRKDVQAVRGHAQKVSKNGADHRNRHQ